MYLAKIKTEGQNETVFVEAKSYTEVEVMLVQAHPDVSIKSVSPSKLNFVLKSENEEDECFFKCRILCIYEDGSKDKLTGLIQCSGIEHGTKRLNAEMSEWTSSDNAITSMVDTNASAIISPKTNEEEE